MSSAEKNIDFFSDGMRIFIDYIKRQYKKNDEYLPHPIIRAFENGLSHIDSIEVGEKVIGTSSNSINERVYSPYAVVLEKEEEGIKVLEIKNLQVKKDLPLELMVVIFRIQIHLDKIEGDTITPQEMVEIMNEVIPGNNFVLLGNRWKEARDKFKKLLEKGKIHFPIDQKLIDELSNITQSTPWEEYSNRLRSLIGGVMGNEIAEGGQILITSPLDSEIEKHKVFESSIEFLLGQASEYLNLREKLGE